MILKVQSKNQQQQNRLADHSSDVESQAPQTDCRPLDPQDHVKVEEHGSAAWRPPSAFAHARAWGRGEDPGLLAEPACDAG